MSVSRCVCVSLCPCPCAPLPGRPLPGAGKIGPRPLTESVSGPAGPSQRVNPSLRPRCGGAVPPHSRSPLWEPLCRRRGRRLFPRPGAAERQLPFSSLLLPVHPYLPVSPASCAQLQCRQLSFLSLSLSFPFPFPIRAAPPPLCVFLGSPGFLRAVSPPSSCCAAAPGAASPLRRTGSHAWRGCCGRSSRGRLPSRSWISQVQKKLLIVLNHPRGLQGGTKPPGLRGPPERTRV